MFSVLSIIGLGLGFGIVHVLTGPDHLSALATLSANVPTHKAFFLGVQWGIGHSIGLVIVAIFLLVATNAKSEGDEEVDMPENVSNILESLVGVFMILLGLYGCWNALNNYRQNLETREEIGENGIISIDSNSHHHHNLSSTKESITEFSVFQDEELAGGNSATNNSSYSLSPTRRYITLCIGIVHGISGPGGVLGVLPAVYLGVWSLSLLYLGCFCLSSCLIMGIFAAFYGTCSTRLGVICFRRHKDGKFCVELFSAFLSVMIGVLWLLLLSMGILDDIFP